MKKTFFLLIVWLATIAAALFVSGKYQTSKCSKTSDTVIVYKTIEVPVPTDSVVTHFITRTLPVVHDTCTIATTDTIRDSVRVEIPITRKTYQGEDYRAVVSGYEVNLDTISVISRTVTNTIIKKPPRFGVGPTVGYGMTNKGLSPYIGIGVYYNLFTF